MLWSICSTYWTYPSLTKQTNGVSKLFPNFTEIFTTNKMRSTTYYGSNNKLNASKLIFQQLISIKQNASLSPICLLRKWLAQKSKTIWTFFLAACVCFLFKWFNLVFTKYIHHIKMILFTFPFRESTSNPSRWSPTIVTSLRSGLTDVCCININ